MAVQPVTWKISPNDKTKLTGYPIDDGSVHEFKASGYWSNWFIGRRPGGYRGFLLDIFKGPPEYPGHPRLCLLGQIDGGDPFRIGSGCLQPFPQGGTLTVFANDVKNPRSVNRGAVELTISPVIPGTPTPPAASEEAGLPGAGAPPLKPLSRPGEAIGRRLAGCAEGLRKSREFFVRARGIPFTALLVYGVAAILLFQPGRDLLQTEAEELGFSYRSLYLLISVLLLAFQVWFWTRAVIISSFRTRPADDSHPRLRRAVPAALAVASFRTRPADDSHPRLRRAVPAALAVGWIGLVALALIPQGWGAVGVLIGVACALGFVLHSIDTYLDRAMSGWPAALWALATLALVVAFAVWAIASPVEMGWELGAPAVVFLALALVVPVVVCLVQWGAAVGIPTGTLLVALAILFGIAPFCSNDAVGRRTEAVPVDLAYERSPRINLESAYKDWLKFQDPSNPVMVLVAAQGGASRAGFWTGEALARLDARTGGAIRSHIFAINAVSGGGVGATGYIAALHLNAKVAAVTDKDRSCQLDCPETPLRKQLQAFTGADALGPAMTGILFADMLYRFAPFLPLLPDRAATLEMAWEAAWRESCGAEAPDCPELLTKPFLTLGRPQKDRWTPLLIIQGTHQESGRRILTSRLDLTSDEVDALDFYDLNELDVPISTAIHNGARFPYISPAGELVRNGKTSGHIVDGGYFDAAGVETVRELGRALSSAHPELTIIYVLIGYSGVAEVKHESGDELQLPKPDRWINEIVAPPLAIIRSRPGHGGHLMLELAGTVAGDVGVGGNPFTVRSGAKNHYIPLILYDQSKGGRATLEVPMNWTLSSKVREHIRSSIACTPNNAEACGASANLQTMQAIERVVDLISPAPLRKPALAPEAWLAVGTLRKPAPELPPTAPPSIQEPPEACLAVGTLCTPVPDLPPTAPDPRKPVTLTSSTPAITVQPGSNLWTLAREHYGSGVMYPQILAANHEQIRNPDLIYPGQILRMPAPDAAD